MLLIARIFAVTLLLAVGAILGLVSLAGTGYFSSGKPIFFGSDGVRTLLCYTADGSMRLTVEFRDKGHIALLRTLQGKDARLVFKKGLFEDIYSDGQIQIQLDPEVKVAGIDPASNCDWE
ncbi:hypothetical protein [Microvirga pudoricolor]|uniref:hypothetical protein n=1 Tax=Microvirga pudoricolor TaxID=2778729 RepID=UPI00195265E2|nr:hypothetical protein [Microvirga pudoricolor]MBM6593998.1 hypothetical protein [Microvirga pudoricolor]